MFLNIHRGLPSTPPTNRKNPKTMKTKSLLIPLLFAALLTGSARAQVYISSNTTAGQVIDAANTYWYNDATANWATAIGGSTYTSWPSAGTTQVGFTNATIASTIRLSTSYTISGMELYKNQTGAFAIGFGSGTGGLTLTLNGNMSGQWNPASESELAVNFSSTNVALRGTYTVTNTATNNSTLVVTSSGNQTVGGNMTLGSKAVFSMNSSSAGVRPALDMKLNLAGGSVRIGAAGGNQQFASGVAELKGNSTASTISNISAVSGMGNATFKLNQASDTTYVGTFIAKSSGSWTLDKNGSGSLTLTGNNSNMTYVSATTVAINAGSVIGASDAAFGNAALSNITVGGNGTLGVANRANLGVHDVSLAAGSLLSFDLAGAVGFTDTQLLIGGNQLGAFDIPINLTNISGLADGAYPLIQVTGSMAGTFSKGTGWGGATLATDSNNVYLVVGIPEPGTFALAGLGISILVGWRLKRRVG